MVATRPLATLPSVISSDSGVGSVSSSLSASPSPPGKQAAPPPPRRHFAATRRASASELRSACAGPRQGHGEARRFQYCPSLKPPFQQALAVNVSGRGGVRFSADN